MKGNNNNKVWKKTFLFSTFVNRPITMSYTPVFGSKGIYDISRMWGLKMSNNSKGGQKIKVYIFYLKNWFLIRFYLKLSKNTLRISINLFEAQDILKSL